MSTSLYVNIKGLPNEELVCGFPGISATWPRLEGTVEIRSKDAKPVQMMLVQLALYRTDVIHPPSNKPGISGPRKEQSFLVGDKTTLFRASAGNIYDEVIALDLPFLLELPTSKPLPVSISVGKSLAETFYHLYVTVTHSKSITEHFPSPVRIKRYDTLSTFGAFRIPIGDTISSSDHIVVVQYSIPTSSVGPTDDIIAYISINGNPDWKSKSKKVKIQRITMSLVEVITFNHEGDEKTEKRRKVIKTAQIVDSKIPEEGYSTTLSLQFPQADLRDKDGLIQKEANELPLSSKNGCSTESSLYKIEYLLVIKARLNHAKDIEIEQPITVTSFDHATCMSFMKSISGSVRYASIAGAQHATPAAKVHHANNPQSMWQYGKPGSTKGAQLLVR